ncbi:MAG TPA: PHP domain-containing protein [Myxococcales bacterium]|nr:PHP domain-containing protein [Myxococcales bacterium]
MIAGFFRKIFTLVILALVLVLGTLTFFAVTAASSGYPNAPRSGRPKGVVLGAYHVHTVSSDGTGTAEDVAQAALNTGLQFVILTDHNPARLRPPHYASNRVLIIEAAELSTPFGHVVALDPERVPTPQELEKDPIQAIRAAGGYAVLAHPVQERNGWKGDPAQARLAAGFELYSGDTLFRRAQAAPISLLLPALGAYVTNPIHALEILVQEDPAAEAKLLELSQGSPMVALCAHDAHGYPSYDDFFEQMAMTIPLGDTPALPGPPDEAARWIMLRLLEGKAYCTFRALGEGAGFALEPELPGRRAKVGDTLKVVVPPETPASAVMVVCHGGCEVQKDGRKVLLKQKGPAHVEVLRRAPGRFFGAEWKPWIVPSPVLVDD